jgi:predicted nicotinamide N-methyase
VVATDRHPDTVGFLRENEARNGVRVRYERFDWAGEVPTDVGHFDRVVASDVLYTIEMPEVLAAAFDRFLGPTGVGSLTDPGRPWLQAFADAPRRRGLSVEVDVVGDADAVFLLTVTREARPRP